MVVPVTVIADPNPPRKAGLSMLRRRSWRSKSPKGDGGTKSKGDSGVPATPTKKGRGKRPVVNIADGGGGGGGGVESPHGGVDLGGGWVMYTDSEGFQYCWNEALQESR